MVSPKRRKYSAHGKYPTEILLTIVTWPNLTQCIVKMITPNHRLQGKPPSSGATEVHGSLSYKDMNPKKDQLDDKDMLFEIQTLLVAPK